MAKKIKFNLIVDGVRCRNIEDVKNNFNVLDLIEYLKNGKLLRWAQVRNLDELGIQIENINSKDDLETAKKLCEMFEINCDESNLKNELNQTIEQLNDKSIIKNLNRFLKDIDNRIKELEKNCSSNNKKVYKEKERLEVITKEEHINESEEYADILEEYINKYTNKYTNKSNEPIYFKYINNLGLLVRDEVIEMSKTKVMFYLQEKLGNGWRLPKKDELEKILSLRHLFRNIKQITDMDLVYIQKDANFNKKYVIAVRKFGSVNNMLSYIKNLESKNIQTVIEYI